MAKATLSFSDVYKKSEICIDHSEEDISEKRQMFTFFLEALAIKSDNLKKNDEENAESSWPFGFNSEGEKLLLGFLNNRTKGFYKSVRSRKFSQDYREEYKAVIDQVSSNMASLGYSQDEIFRQKVSYWLNLRLHSLPLSWIMDCLDGVKQLTDYVTAINSNEAQWDGVAFDDLIYVDPFILEDYRRFQEKWIYILKEMREERNSRVALLGDGENPVSTFIEKIRKDLTFQEDLDIKEYEQTHRLKNEKAIHKAIQKKREKQMLVVWDFLMYAIMTPELSDFLPEDLDSKSIYNAVIRDQLRAQYKQDHITYNRSQKKKKHRSKKRYLPSSNAKLINNHTRNTKRSIEHNTKNEKSDHKKWEKNN